MGIFKVIEKRNEKQEDDQEYIIRQTDDFNDNMYRGYSQEEILIKESQIIKDIKKGGIYKTKKSDGTFTEIEIKEREGKDYIASIGNDTENDNLGELPTF